MTLDQAKALIKGIIIDFIWVEDLVLDRSKTFSFNTDSVGLEQLNKLKEIFGAERVYVDAMVRYVENNYEGGYATRARVEVTVSKCSQNFPDWS